MEILHSYKAKSRPSTKPGSDCLDHGLDCRSDRTPDQIGSDWTGIFAFSAEELF